MAAQSDQPGGGTAALDVAIAHLAELLRSVDSANSRAMFLVGLNVASSSLFIAVLASLRQPWQAAGLPVLIAFVTVVAGLWVLWNRRTPQFPNPTALLRARGRGLTDDELSWAAIAAIEVAAAEVKRQVNRVTRWVTAIVLLMAIHAMTLIVTGIVLVVD